MSYFTSDTQRALLSVLVGWDRLAHTVPAAAAAATAYYFYSFARQPACSHLGMHALWLLPAVAAVIATDLLILAPSLLSMQNKKKVLSSRIASYLSTFLRRTQTIKTNGRPYLILDLLRNWPQLSDVDIQSLDCFVECLEQLSWGI